MNIHVLSVTVRKTDLADTILFELDETIPLAGLPFLGEEADAVAQLEMQAGKGVEWCHRVFGIAPRIIDARGTAPSWLIHR